MTNASNEGICVGI